ncbi:MAG TPA: hypothetical protein VGI54_10835 [Solirubrobacteraceae bacterium]
MEAAGPNWAEQVTAIATAVLALGVIGAAAAAVLGAQQVREARRSRQAQMAAEFFRRWNEDPLVEARQLAARFATPEELAAAFQSYVAENAREAYVLYRELDFFEQLAALERSGAFDFALIKLVMGESLIAGWERWSPAIQAVHGDEVYPLFRDLVERMRRAVAAEGPAEPP